MPGKSVREGPMPMYRFYWIGDDDHIRGADDVECASDAEARAAAKERMGKFPTVEIWQGKRYIARLVVRHAEVASNAER